MGHVNVFIDLLNPITLAYSVDPTSRQSVVFQGVFHVNIHSCIK